METITKAELLAILDEQLPDDATIIGYSEVAGEFFDVKNAGLLLTPNDDEDEDAIEATGATHLFNFV